MPVLLIMQSADQTKRVFRMSESAVTIGRDVHCDIRISLPSVAPRHARIIEDDDGLRLIDLAGTNAAEAEGRPAPRPQPLADGDEITVGPVRFVVRVGNDADFAESPRLRELMSRSLPTHGPGQGNAPAPPAPRDPGTGPI